MQTQFDIISYLPWPSCALSNFAQHEFEFDGVMCNSMEGLLSSFKCKDVYNQQQICLLDGMEAKIRGKSFNWKKDHFLYWKGKSYDRFGDEYQELLDEAYYSLAFNSDFREALLATGEKELIHSIGSNNIKMTLLTNDEFCSRLMFIRNFIEGL